MPSPVKQTTHAHVESPWTELFTVELSYYAADAPSNFAAYPLTVHGVAFGRSTVVPDALLGNAALIYIGADLITHVSLPPRAMVAKRGAIEAWNGRREAANGCFQ